MPKLFCVNCQKEVLVFSGKNCPFGNHFIDKKTLEKVVEELKSGKLTPAKMTEYEDKNYKEGDDVPGWIPQIFMEFAIELGVEIEAWIGQGKILKNINLGEGVCNALVDEWARCELKKCRMDFVATFYVQGNCYFSQGIIPAKYFYAQKRYADALKDAEKEKEETFQDYEGLADRLKELERILSKDFKKKEEQEQLKAKTDLIFKLVIRKEGGEGHAWGLKFCRGDNSLLFLDPNSGLFEIRTDKYGVFLKYMKMFYPDKYNGGKFIVYLVSLKD